MRAALLSLILLTGCNLYEPIAPKPVVKPVKPSPTEPSIRRALFEYGDGVADAFDSAADKFDRHIPSPQIADEMGDDQREDRLAAFFDLMQEVKDLNPPEDSNEERRYQADAARAAMLRKRAAEWRKWAAELREGGK